MTPEIRLPDNFVFHFVGFILTTFADSPSFSHQLIFFLVVLAIHQSFSLLFQASDLSFPQVFPPLPPLCTMLNHQDCFHGF